MNIIQLRQRLHAFGAKPCHEQRILRAWLQARALDSGSRRLRAADHLPLALREALPRVSAELDELASETKAAEAGATA